MLLSQNLINKTQRECIKCERTNAEKNKEERRVFVCAYVCVVFEKACELGREGQRLNRKECV